MESPTHLVQRRPLALSVLQRPIPNILVIRPIPERHPHDGRRPDIEPLRLLAIIHEIRHDAHDTRTPAVEPKHLVGEIDDLPPLGVGELGTATRAARVP